MHLGPIQLIAYITGRCNLKCEFCRRQRGELKTAIPEVTPAILKRAFDMFPSITGVSVAGFGEPLLASCFSDSVNYCFERGKNVVLSTNGLAWKKHIDDVPWARLLQVSLSVNEIDRELYQETTGVDGLPRVIQAAKFYKEQGAKLGMTFVVGKHNWSRMKQYMHFAKRLEADFIAFFNTLPHHDGEEKAEWFRSRVLTTNDTEYLRAEEDIRKVAPRIGLTVHTWPTLVRSPDTCEIGCSSPFNMLGVDGLGNITGCCRILPPRAEYGNLDDGPGLWTESEHLKWLRGMIQGESELQFPCTDCFGAYYPRADWFMRATRCVYGDQLPR